MNLLSAHVYRPFPAISATHHAHRLSDATCHHNQPMQRKAFLSTQAIHNYRKYMLIRVVPRSPPFVRYPHTNQPHPSPQANTIRNTTHTNAPPVGPSSL